MSRARWKGPYTSLKKNASEKDSKPVMFRSIEIIPKFIGLTFRIHNGKSYDELVVTENMLGHKFGEFCFTRAKFSFKKKQKKKSGSKS